MTQQGFYIGNNDWYIMCFYDICSEKDLWRTEDALIVSGCDTESVNKAIDILKNKNTGYTYTSFDKKLTLMFISHTTSAEEMYDSIQHELKHAVEHISEYYNVNPKSEESAYLQGEIARNMFAAAVYIVCPNCH